MDKMFEISLLMDFYGQLLTERQYEILDLHFNNDYSLGEIAEQLSISRQGVYDNIKRGKNLLESYEERIELVKKFTLQKDSIKEILDLLQSIDKNVLSDRDSKVIDNIEEKIKNIIEI